jgi:iron complex transport system permease protein
MRARFLLFLLALDLLVLIVGLSIGSSSVGIGDIFDFLHGSASTTAIIIIKEIRLPRTLVAMVVGAGLATAGCILQALFRNPLADPYILGVSGGASAGAAVVILLGFASTASITSVAFISSLLTAFIVYRLGAASGKIPIYTLLLAGVAMASFLAGVTSLLIYMAGRNIHQVIFWIMGGFWTANWIKVEVASIPIIVGILYALYKSWNLNAILMGEEHALSVGIDVESFKKKMIAISALVTSAAVSVSGVIGFVGLITPHAMRLIVGEDHRILLPASILCGAAFMPAVDVVARIVTAGEIPVGIITALLGAPFFIYLLRSKYAA